MASIITKTRKKGADAIYVKMRYTDENGQRKQKLIPCKDKFEAREVQKTATEYEKEGREYVYVRPASYNKKTVKAFTPDEITVAQLMPEYITFGLSKQRWTPNTLRNKESLIRNHILPYIGDVKIASITPEFMQDFFDDLPKHKAARGNHISEPKNNSRRQVEEVKKVLHPAFDYAVYKRYIQYNPITAAVTIKRAPQQRRDQWSAQECVTAFSNCDDENLRPLVLTMFAGPCRTSEVTGLMWDCVHLPENPTDEDPGTIVIKRELVEMSLEELKRVNDAITEKSEKIIPYIDFPSIQARAKTHKMIIERTKTESERTIFLPLYITDVLKEHKKRQEELKEQFSDVYQDYNLVFALTDRFPGRPISSSTASRWFKKFCEGNGIKPVTMYSLRGAGTSEKVIMAGDPKTVIGDTGNSLAVMMRFYAQASKEKRKELAAKMDAGIFEKLRAAESEKQAETD